MVVEVYPNRQKKEPMIFVPNYVYLLTDHKVLINSIQIYRNNTFKVVVYVPKKIIEVFPCEDIVKIHDRKSSNIVTRTSANVVVELADMIRTFLHEEQK